jgi:hypothetical protein
LATHALKASSRSANRIVERWLETLLAFGFSDTPEALPGTVVGLEMVNESEPTGSFEGTQTRIESMGRVEAAGEFMGTIVSRAIKQKTFNQMHTRPDPICPPSSLFRPENIVLNRRSLEPKMPRQADSLARLANQVK